MVSINIVPRKKIHVNCPECNILNCIISWYPSSNIFISILGTSNEDNEDAVETAQSKAV